MSRNERKRIDIALVSKIQRETLECQRYSRLDMYTRYEGKITGRFFLCESLKTTKSRSFKIRLIDLPD